MQEVKLSYVCTFKNPDKPFLICDLSDGRKFCDPLILFGLPEYDVFNINKEGLFALGGELTIPNLLNSYKWGIFPWFAYKESEEPHWYCPRDRFVIFPDKIHISHSLKNALNKKKYNLTINHCFRDVIHNCRVVNSRDEDDMAWLGEQIESLFIELHNRGYAKSVELWEEDKLVGGFYGFWRNGVFQGESMFSLEPSASQIALIKLCQLGDIEGEKIKFIDTQFETPTFKKLGGEFIKYEQYREMLDNE